jgi:membrane-associated HD superfamily phosphohydrolase
LTSATKTTQKTHITTIGTKGITIRAVGTSGRRTTRRGIMRSLLTLVVNIVFLIGYDVYVYLRANGLLTDRFMQKAYMYSVILLLTAPMMLMGNSNKKNGLEIELRKIAQFTYISILLTIIINQFGILENPIHSVLLFNGINIVLLVIIGVNLYRHGFFKRK